MEFLLAGDSANVWERITRWEHGNQIDFTDCQKKNTMIFMAADIDKVQRILYTYNTDICDSLSFCSEYPEYCMSDTALCSAYPDYCANLGPDTLFIAIWEVTGVTGDDEITDQLRIKFSGFSNYAKVTQISSQSYEWEFDESTPGIGTPVKIRETYKMVR